MATSSAIRPETTDAPLASPKVRRPNCWGAGQRERRIVAYRCSICKLMVPADGRHRHETPPPAEAVAAKNAASLAS